MVTKRKFVKQLRSLGVSETTIKNYTNMVAKLGGKMSYEDVFDKLIGRLIQRCIYECVCGNEQYKMDYKPYVVPEFNFDNNMRDYLMHYCYGSTILNPQTIKIIR